MEYVLKCILPLLFLFIGCGKDCNKECASVSGSYDIALLNERQEDLLSGPNADSISIVSLTSLKTPALGELSYEVQDNFGGTFQTSANLLWTNANDLFTENDNGEFERTEWILTYQRLGELYVDTIGHTPVDRSTECCLSYSTIEFSYTGQKVLSVVQEENFPIFRVVLRD